MDTIPPEIILKVARCCSAKAMYRFRCANRRSCLVLRQATVRVHLNVLFDDCNNTDLWQGAEPFSTCADHPIFALTVNVKITIPCCLDVVQR